MCSLRSLDVQVVDRPGGIWMWPYGGITTIGEGAAGSAT